MKIEPKSESDSEKTAEIPFVGKTSKEDNNFHKPTAILGCSQEQTLTQNESKHVVKVKIKNLKPEAYIWARTSSQTGKGGQKIVKPKATKKEPAKFAEKGFKKKS